MMYQFEPSGLGEIALVDIKDCRRVKYRIIEYGYYFNVETPPVGQEDNWSKVATFTNIKSAEEYIWIKLAEEKKNECTDEEEYLSGGSYREGTGLGSDLAREN